MTQHVPTKSLNAPLSRRQVMIGVAGLSFALAVGGRAGAAVLAAEQTGKALSPWVSIAPDGTITIMSAATEMGQGSMTSLPTGRRCAWCRRRRSRPSTAIQASKA